MLKTNVFTPILVLISLVLPLSQSWAQELEIEYSSTESEVRYPSLILAENDILTAAKNGSQGPFIAERCENFDSYSGIPTKTMSLGYCVAPNFVKHELSQGTPQLYQTFVLFSNLGCNDVCPHFDEFGNDYCSGLGTEVCLTEDDVKDAIVNWYSEANHCSASYLYDSSSWAMRPPDTENYWSFAGFPGDTAGYRVLYDKGLTFGVYSPAESGGCTYSEQSWTIRSFTHRACAVSYYLNEPTEPTFVPGWSDPWEEPSCGNYYNAFLYIFGNKEKNKGDCGTDNPCHPTTGVKTLREQDYSSPTLEIVRYFHSEMWEKDYSALGRGWSHNYSERINTEGPNGVLRLLDGTGDVEQFRCAGDPLCSVYQPLSSPGTVLEPVEGGWLLRMPDGTKKMYDQDGRLTEIEKNSTTYSRVQISYNEFDRISEVVDQQGRSIVFQYDSSQLLEAVVLPDGSSIQYQYELPSSVPSYSKHQVRLIRVVNEDLSERIYHYEDQNPDTSPRNPFLITGITDENGSRYSTYSYDEHGRPVSSELAGGAGRVLLEYTRRPGETENWTITNLTRPLGEVETYSMQPFPFRKPTEVSDSRGSISINYQSFPRWRSSLTDREGNLTTYEYADSLHETRRTEAVGTLDERIIETDWDNAINRILERREPGKTTTYTHNTRGQVLTRTETATTTLATRTWTYTYFEIPSTAELIGKLATMDGPRTDVSDVTSYAYYTSDDPGGAFLKGDVHTITNALGHVTEYLAYDGNGRPLQIKDANNVTTIITYHARGWISSRTTDGQTTTFAYDNAGNLTRVTQPDGSFTSYEYDDAHRLDAIADNFNNRIEYTLDADGNRTAEQTYNDLGVLRRQMSRVYDQLGRLQKLIDGNLDETTYAYDNNGNRISSQDANLNSTSFEYDPLDRLVKAIDASLGETLMSFDERDNLTTVADPLGNVTNYIYDGLDNQIQLDSPDTGITVYEHDDAGNRTAATDARGVRVEYAYDALNRLTLVDYADNTLDVSFTYDVGTNGKGRLTSMMDAAGTETYGYDARGNLVSVTRDINGTNYITAYAYNGADRLTQITYPSGMVVDYTLDAAGRVVAVDKTVDSVTESLITGVVYEPFGPVSDFTFGNGLTMSASFDQDYELDNLQSGALDWVFGYDGTGNILSIADQAIPANNQLFTYDDLYRLDTAQGGYGAEDFDYDSNGNRTRYVSDVVDDPYTYEPQSSRLATQNGWSFSRDAAGNRLDKLNALGHGQLYSYGDHNRLSQVADRDAAGDTVLGTYIHDGRGQRVSKTAGGVTTHFVYGLNGELLGEYQGDSTPIKEFAYLNGQPIASIQEGFSEQVLEVVEMDNGDPGTSSTGTWTVSTDAQQYQEDYLLANKSSANTYRWTPSLTANTHRVSAWWVADNSHSNRAEYTIVHGGGTFVKTISQKQDGGQWNYITLTDFSAIQYVEVSAINGKVAADGVRFSELDPCECFGLSCPPCPPIQSGKATYFIHTDHLGTPRAVSDDTQSVVWRWDSRPFGEGAPDEDPDGDSIDFELNLRFPGQYYDAESGLHYNYFRDYDPGVGRYVGSDPARFINGTNLFAYVRSNPVLFVDPLGLALLGRVSCDGNGNWQKEIFTEDECLVDCVDRHEQIHLEYVTVLFGKEACEGVPAGQMPTADVRIASQYNATYTHQECRALKDSNSCFSDLAKKGCESGCREKAENLIEQIMRQATNLGCWWAL